MKKTIENLEQGDVIYCFYDKSGDELYPNPPQEDFEVFKEVIRTKYVHSSRKDDTPYIDYYTDKNKFTITKNDVGKSVVRYDYCGYEGYRIKRKVLYLFTSKAEMKAFIRKHPIKETMDKYLNIFNRIDRDIERL